MDIKNNFEWWRWYNRLSVAEISASLEHLKRKREHEWTRLNILRGKSESDQSFGRDQWSGVCVTGFGSSDWKQSFQLS